MSWLASLVLSLLHSFYSLVIYLFALSHFLQPVPKPLTTPRKRLPSHLALLLHLEDNKPDEATEECLMESLRRATAWARAAGIQRLTVYDRHGILAGRTGDIACSLDTSSGSTSDDSTDSDYEYPLTPPLSDVSDSRPLSPEYENLADLGLGIVTIRIPALRHAQKRKSHAVKRRRTQRKSNSADVQPLTLHLLSPQSSKASIAAVSRALLRRQTFFARKDFSANMDEITNISMEELNSILEGQTQVQSSVDVILNVFVHNIGPHGFPSPDLLLVHYITGPKHHRIPLELQGFPPWQIRLTEICHNQRSIPTWTLPPWRRRHIPTHAALDETDFRRALDEYAVAEMRFGK